MSNCKKFGILSVDNVVPGRSGNGMITVGSHLAGSARVANVTWTNHTTTGNVAATELIGGGLGNTGASGNITLTLPSAASVIAAFADTGIDAFVGMTFTVPVTSFAAHSTTIAASTSITFDNAAASVAVASQKSASFLFRVASITSGAESIVVDSIVGN